MYVTYSFIMYILKEENAQGNSILMQIGETEIACSDMWQRASKLTSDYPVYLFEGQHRL